jgi:hypothetical protein
MSPQQLPVAECRALPVSFRGVQSRLWNGVAIQRRVADGYVNATRMCKANGKRWHDYIRYDRSQAYIDALAVALGSAGNPADLTRQVMTGPNHLRGTWVHPRLAVDLARWISPQFAVWMDGWFLESITTTPTPLPTPRKRRPRPAPPIAPPPAQGVLADCSQIVWDNAPHAERICHGLLYLTRRIDTYDPLHQAFSRRLMANMIRHFERLMDIQSPVEPDDTDQFVTARARSVARVLLQELCDLSR